MQSAVIYSFIMNMGKVNSHRYFIVQLQKIKKRELGPATPHPEFGPSQY